MAIAYDDDSGGVAGSASSLTFSHTCTGSDLLLLVGVSLYNLNGATISSVTYNSVAMTLVDTAVNSSRRASLYRLVAPSTGANDVVITLSASEFDIVGGSMSFTGVDQTTPLGTAATANGNSTAPSVNVSAATDDLVAAILCIEHSGTLSVGAGQTSRYSNIGGAGFIKGAGSTEPGAATTTMSWSDTVGGPWGIVGVSIKPKAGTGGGAVPRAIHHYSLMRG